jgi:hypothetical protein
MESDLDISIAGASKDQKLAAIITPAVNPSIKSMSFLFTCMVQNTTAAPKAVNPQVKQPPESACNIGSNDLKLLYIWQTKEHSLKTQVNSC